MNNGWIKLHRKLLNSPLAKKPAWAWLWVTLLLMASHDNKERFIWNNKEITLEKGQFITGRKRLKEITGIPETTIEDILNYLESQHQIRQQKATKYRLITIVKWEDYQKDDRFLDNRATTERQQSDTIKNVKNDKKEKNNTNTIHTKQLIIKEMDKPLKKKVQGQISSKDMNDVYRVVEAFKPVNKFWHTLEDNPKQMDAAYRMIQIAGLETVLKVIAILPKTNKMSYVSNISSPVKLEEKWSDLESQLLKIKSVSESKIKKIL